jgi:magnesium transporter
MNRILGTADGHPDTSGGRPRSSAIIDCGLYVHGERQAGEWHYVEALEKASATDGAFVWLGLHEPSAEEMAGIADTFGLHELAVEDAVKAEQRP